MTRRDILTRDSYFILANAPCCLNELYVKNVKKKSVPEDSFYNEKDCPSKPIGLYFMDVGSSGSLFKNDLLTPLYITLCFRLTKF